MLRQYHKWYHGPFIRSMAFTLSEMEDHWMVLSGGFQRIILVATLRIDYSKAKSSVKAEMNLGFMELYKIWAVLFKQNR